MPGGSVAGLRDRVGALDGAQDVSSPPGRADGNPVDPPVPVRRG